MSHLLLTRINIPRIRKSSSGFFHFFLKNFRARFRRRQASSQVIIFQSCSKPRRRVGAEKNFRRSASSGDFFPFSAFVFFVFALPKSGVETEISSRRAHDFPARVVFRGLFRRRSVERLDNILYSINATKPTSRRSENRRKPTRSTPLRVRSRQRGVPP